MGLYYTAREAMNKCCVSSVVTVQRNRHHFVYKGHDYVRSVIILMAERSPSRGLPRLWKWLGPAGDRNGSCRERKCWEKQNDGLLGEFPWNFTLSSHSAQERRNGGKKRNRKEVSSGKGKGDKRCPNRGQRRVSGDHFHPGVDGHGWAREKRPSTPDQLPLPLSNACCQGQDYRAKGFILRSRIQERRVNDSISMFLGKNVLIVGHLWKEYRCPSLSIEVWPFLKELIISALSYDLK